MSDPLRESLVRQITDQLCNIPEVHRYCDRVARRESGTVFWTSDDFEAAEDTAQYDLYWSIYSSVHAQLALEAAQCLIGSYSS